MITVRKTVMFDSKYGFNTIQCGEILNHSKLQTITTDDGTTFVTMREIQKAELPSDYEHYDENFTEKKTSMF